MAFKHKGAVVVLALLLATAVLLATSTGNVFPTTCANVDRAAQTAWTNPTNAASDNATDATVVVPSDYLVCNFSFSIPAGATVGGVTFDIEASETGTGNSNYIPQLASNTTPTLIGSAKSAVTVNGTTKVVSSNGGIADLWSAAITAAMINSGTFSGVIWSTDATNTLAVDFTRMAVEYSVSSPGIIPNFIWRGSKPVFGFQLPNMRQVRRAQR